MKVVILDGYALNPGDLSWDKFKEFGEVSIYDRTEEEEILERCLGAEVIITNKTPLKKEILEKLTDLKYIGVLATGYDVIDIEFARKKGIPVANIPNYGSESVAQLVFAFILEFANKVHLHHQSIKKGEWAEKNEFSYFKAPLMEISGKTIGIIGMGAIGQQVAKIALGFNMKVLAFSRTKKDFLPEGEIEWVSLEELLKRSDFVTLHVPLTDKTENMINKKRISLMKDTAYLINTSRGKLIVEEDLAEALKDNKIKGAALDVLSQEPPTEDNPMLKAKNCILTPHIAWGTIEARSRLMSIAYDNLKAFLEGKAVNVVNK